MFNSTGSQIQILRIVSSRSPSPFSTTLSSSLATLFIGTSIVRNATCGKRWITSQRGLEKYVTWRRVATIVSLYTSILGIPLYGLRKISTSPAAICIGPVR
jgi:hypothetical protein